ncbi:MAG TPA: hypothetical protein VH539_15515 [Gemmatimonadaceae bacterium]|jgi:hypothetical protein
MKPTTTTPTPSPLGLDPATANTLARTTASNAAADAQKLAEVAARPMTSDELSSIAAGKTPR